MINEEIVSKTVSNLFLVPLLNIQRATLDRFGLINSYLFNGEDDVVYENALHLLFSPIDVRGFNMFVKVQKNKHHILLDERDYPGNLILLTFKLPEEFKEDYKKIWDGKYSQVSQKFKDAIPSVVKYVNSKQNTVSNMSIQHMIFERYQPLRLYWENKFNVALDDNQELWTKPTIESETFKLRNNEPITINA